ncbi:GntR family transcriptional regulator [Mycobacterium sp. E1747]|uniref:GntR family transcriptional regulator n=1 Tax=Mycobacterium sp. E1747 TaxID=1834128 RepID=UPI0007FDA7A0|nr:GntR family transcriptional regulator [Mycobacterium sp. E1747]OBH08856.1 GntR family transcriptional regulator [Mycobacterium sp. E1747]
MTHAVPDLDLLPAACGRRTDQALLAVRTAIDRGEMKPGMKYSVYQLAKSLGISRTPTREALLRLEDAGLITFQARQGFTLRVPEPREIAEIFAVRLALETLAARRAAAFCDQQLAQALSHQRGLMHDAAAAADETAFAQHDLRLHDLIMEAAGNNRARAIVKSLRETTRLLGASTADNTRTLHDIETEHDPVLSAIIDRDADRAELAMRTHLVNTGKLLVIQAIECTKSSACLNEVWSAAVEESESPTTVAPGESEVRADR